MIDVTCAAALMVLLIVCTTLYCIGLFSFGHRALFVRNTMLHTPAELLMITVYCGISRAANRVHNTQLYRALFVRLYGSFRRFSHNYRALFVRTVGFTQERSCCHDYRVLRRVAHDCVGCAANRVRNVVLLHARGVKIHLPQR